MRRTRRRRGLLLATLAAALTGLAAPAGAEGGFDSYLAGWSIGAESRTWLDENKDNTNGYAQFAGCSADHFRISVYKEDTGPDTQVGTETMQCRSGSLQTSDRVYFGDVSRDEYHFTLKTAVPGLLWVDQVRVRY